MKLFFLLAVVYAAVLNAAVFQQYPWVYFDEAMYTEPARNLIRYGDDGLTSIPAVMHVDKEFIFCGKLTTMLNSAMFYLFRYGFVQARALSMIIAILNIFLAFKVIGLIADRKTAILSVIALMSAVDILPTKLGRPDMLIMGGMLLTVYAGLTVGRKRACSDLSSRPRTGLKSGAWVTGLVSTVGLWIHLPTAPLAFVMAILLYFGRPYRDLIHLFAGQFSGVIVFSLLVVLPNYEMYVAQIREFALGYYLGDSLGVHRLVNIAEGFVWYFFTRGSGRNVVLLAMLVTAATVLLLKRKFNGLKWLAYCLMAHVAISFLSPYGGRLYWMYYLPFVFMVICEGIVCVPRLEKVLFAAFFGYFIAQGVLLYAKYGGDDDNSRREALACRFEKGDRVLGDVSLQLFNEDIVIFNHILTISLDSHPYLVAKYSSALPGDPKQLFTNLGVTHVILDDELRGVLGRDTFPRVYRDSFFEYLEKNMELAETHDFHGNIWQIYRIKRP